MTHRTENRFKSKGWRRIVASLLILSWVNVVAQPCLMAMEAGGRTTAAADHRDAMHAEHHAADQAATHCDHCPPAGAAAAGERCVDGINADCGDALVYSAEIRKADVKYKGIDVGYAPSGPPWGCTQPTQADRDTAIDPGLLKRTTAPALSIQFCVFLK